MKTITATPIRGEEAWSRFADWKLANRIVGVVFYGASGNSLYTMARVTAAKAGKLTLQGDSVRAAFQLAEAEYSYGPVQTWPNWPNPPIVEVNAVQVQMKNGDYLILAEGLRPESLPQLTLPE